MKRILLLVGAYLALLVNCYAAKRVSYTVVNPTNMTMYQVVAGSVVYTDSLDVTSSSQTFIPRAIINGITGAITGILHGSHETLTSTGTLSHAEIDSAINEINLSTGSLVSTEGDSTISGDLTVNNMAANYGVNCSSLTITIPTIEGYGTLKMDVGRWGAPTNQEIRFLRWDGSSNASITSSSGNIGLFYSTWTSFGNYDGTYAKEMMYITPSLVRIGAYSTPSYDNYSRLEVGGKIRVQGFTSRYARNDYINMCEIYDPDNNLVVVVTTSSKVGIGTSGIGDLGEKLVVNGNIKSDNLTATYHVTCDTITTNNTQIDNRPVIRIKTSGSAVMGIGADGAGSNYGLGFFNGTTTMGVWETNCGLIVGDGYVTSSAPADGIIVEGCVGISTNVPTNTLHVKGSVRIQATDSTNSAYISNTGGYTKIGDLNNDRVWINNTIGDVGIGVVPSYRLHVVGAVGADAAVFTDNTNSGVHLGAGTLGGHVRSDNNTNLILGSGDTTNFTLAGTSTTCNNLFVLNSGGVFTPATTAELVMRTPKLVGEYWWNTDTNELWVATGTATANQFIHK